MKGKLKTGCLTALSFVALVGLVIYLFGTGVVSRTEGFLMVIMLFGMYVGFGILIASYRFVTKLEDD
ncbi:hypothetical protein OAL14_03180 [Gammaproteobacteria bacterium]|nr:hypothetical protein [Gammaproteobacteria bacterium]